MSPRSIRRAAERKALKMARNAEKNRVERPFQAAMPAFESASTVSQAASPSPTSESQLAANRANSQLSTGPTSETGKAKSSLNAVKTGLTGRTVLLPSDDAAHYEQHVRDIFNEFQPVGARETFLVQSLADTSWRLARIPGLEMAIYAHGRIQFAEMFADHDPALKPALIDMHTFLHYEKHLRNLHLQEGRLRRQHEKDMAELRQLQQDRLAKEQPPAENGFEFSTGTSVSRVATWTQNRDRQGAEHTPDLSHIGFEFSTSGAHQNLDTEPRPVGSGEYA
jgi:hypothetical protein